MTIKDIMQTSVFSVSENSSVKEVVRIIFSTGISAVPVVKGNKLVGIIAESDIIEHMYPKEAESKDADILKSAHLVMKSTVSDVMKTNVKSVKASNSFISAGAIMSRNSFRSLPVVDEANSLIGMVSQGDIFREIIKEELPAMEKDRYGGFISRYYDVMIDWKQRLEQEFPSLFRIFKREQVKNILDLGVWTGTFSIGLAEEGMKVTGLEHNRLMLDAAERKKNNLPNSVKSNIVFKYSDFKKMSKDVSGEFDAVLCLGNSLPYLPEDLKNVFNEAYKLLRDKNGIIILQFINSERVLVKKERLLNFQIQTVGSKEGEHLFLEFLDRRDKNTINHNLTVLDSNSGKWIYKGMTTVPIKNIQVEDVEKSLKEVGFQDVSVAGYQSEYQGEYGPISFIKPFDVKTSDWITVVARKN